MCTLRLKWILLAKDCPHDLCTVAGGDEGGAETMDALTTTAAGATQHDSGKNHPYENAFYMAEFNPSGHIFSVEEIPYRTTLIHLLSPTGQVLETVDLMAGMLGGTAQSRRSPVNTLVLSTYHDGAYAIGLEGGRIAMVDAVTLQLNRTFKVVWQR